jgi:hypothetical protein
MSVVSRDPHQPVTVGMWAELAEGWPDTERLIAAFRLARDLRTCTALLEGLPVAAGLLDAQGLLWARRKRLVRLERPLDLFDVREPAA